MGDPDSVIHWSLIGARLECHLDNNECGFHICKIMSQWAFTQSNRGPNIQPWGTLQDSGLQ